MLLFRQVDLQHWLTWCGTSGRPSCPPRRSSSASAALRGRWRRTRTEGWWWSWSCWRQLWVWQVRCTGESGRSPRIRYARGPAQAGRSAAEEAAWIRWGTSCSRSESTGQRRVFSPEEAAALTSCRKQVRISKTLSKGGTGEKTQRWLSHHKRPKLDSSQRSATFHQKLRNRFIDPVAWWKLFAAVVWLVRSL